MSTLSTPSNSLISRPVAVTMPMPFAQSIGLPPPTATMLSQPSLRNRRAPSCTSCAFGLLVTDVKREKCSIPTSSREWMTSSVQPAAMTSGSLTTSTLRAPTFMAYLPASFLASAPKTNSGATNLRSSRSAAIIAFSQRLPLVSVAPSLRRTSTSVCGNSEGKGRSLPLC